MTDKANRVIGAIWQWRDRAKREEAEQVRKRLRWALIQFVVMLAVGGMLILLRFVLSGAIFLCIACASIACARMAPGIYDALDRVIAAIVDTVRLVLTWLLLVPFFYLCFLSGRLVLLILDRDPMRRKFPSVERTYWIPRPPRRPDHFERQY